MSTTVTKNDAVPVFPAASVAVHETSVGPSGNVLPEAGAHVAAIEPSTMSSADALNVTRAPVGPVASVEKLAGTVTTGAVVSSTVILKLSLVALPASSVAVHVTVVSPSGNVEPDAWSHSGVTEPST